MELLVLLWSDVLPAMDGVVSLLTEVSHDEAKMKDLVGGLIKQLVGSRQRSLSSRFSLSRRERPLLAAGAGKL